MSTSSKRGRVSDAEMAHVLEEAITFQRLRRAEQEQRESPAPARSDPYGDIAANTIPQDDEPVSHTDLPGDGSVDWVGALAEQVLAEKVASERRSPERGHRERGSRGAGLTSSVPSVTASTLDRCLDAHRRRQEAAALTLRDLPSELDPHRLEETGWCVITPAHRRQEYLDALDELLRHREDAAGERFRQDVVYAGESVENFLWDLLETAPGVIDLEKLPYYVLIVGGPDEVPYALQYALSIDRAVGRIAFEDLSGYRRYATAVVAAETAGTARSPSATILSVENGDLATDLLARHLVEPLLERLGEYLDDQPPGNPWSVQALRREQADKNAFRRLLTGADGPALALLSCHGLELDHDNPHQRLLQGALVCQASEQTPIGERLFHAHDVPHNEDITASPLHGLVAFCFACYGAGTPREDDYPQEGASTDAPFTPRVLAPAPFVAAGAQALLEEGALAVVGHVDRGWTLSFAWTLGHHHTEAGRSLEDAVKQLLRGHRLGHAIRALHRRFAAIAAHLAAPLDALRSGKKVNRHRLASTWTAHHDARNFVLLGDPAVYPGGQPMAGTAGTHARRANAMGGGFSLDADAYLHAAREARRSGKTLESWLIALVRTHRDQQADMQMTKLDPQAAQQP